MAANGPRSPLPYPSCSSLICTRHCCLSCCSRPGLGAAGALLYRRRVRALQGRYASIIAERKRIAREWHDTLLGGLSGVSWQLQATRLRMVEPPDQAPHALETAQRMVEHCQAEARRVIWDLRESAAADEPLPEAFASFL